MKRIVIYQSGTGFTAKYAGWIAGISYIAEVVMNKVFDYWGEKNDNEFDGHEV